MYKTGHSLLVSRLASYSLKLYASLAKVILLIEHSSACSSPLLYIINSHMSST